MIIGFKNLSYSSESKIITRNLGSLGWHGIADRIRRFGKRFHTHSAIHEGLYKAAKSLSLDVDWIDGIPADFIFKPNDIIITEPRFLNNTIFNVPKSVNVLIHGESTYFRDLKFFPENFWFFENFSTTKNYIEFTKISEFFYVNESKKIISMSWATDDFIKNPFIPSKIFKKKSETYYIGNFSEDALMIAKSISKKLSHRGIKMLRVSGVNSDSAKHYSVISRLSFDIRCLDHIDKGFIPCRVFKNISYGRGIITNSKEISNAFNGMIPCFHDIEDFDSMIDLYSGGKFDEAFKELMFKIQNNHTYINRLNDILKVVI